MAGRTSPITITDQDLMDDFQTVMSRYAMKPGKPPLRIVTIGRGGQGKSTLINNLLNLQGEAAAKALKSGKPVTTAVRVHENEVNGVMVYIYDTPGLQDCTIDERKIIKEIEKLTNSYVDLLFYVSSLDERINSADERIIKAITHEFKSQVWEHAVLVLTHADHHCDGADYITYTNDFAEVFQMSEEVLGNNPYEIAAIPTGPHREAEPKGWYYNLLIEAANKCDKEATPLLLIATSVFGGHGIVAGSAAQYSHKGATIGGIAGAVTGTALGVALIPPTVGMSLPAGLAIGGGVGAGLGAAAGLATGTAVGAATVMIFHIWPIIKRKKLLEKLKKDQKRTADCC